MLIFLLFMILFLILITFMLYHHSKQINSLFKRILKKDLNEYRFKSTCISMIMLEIITAFIILLFSISCCYRVSQIGSINDRIELYENENKNIHNQIVQIVNNYRDYGYFLYDESLYDIDISDMDVTVISELYSDMQYNPLIKSKIDKYQTNYDKIIALKEENINNKQYKWILYFGKED